MHALQKIWNAVRLMTIDEDMLYECAEHLLNRFCESDRDKRDIAETLADYYTYRMQQIDDEIASKMCDK